jgi:hypothetical protein
MAYTPTDARPFSLAVQKSGALRSGVLPPGVRDSPPDRDPHFIRVLGLDAGSSVHVLDQPIFDAVPTWCRHSSEWCPLVGSF